MDAKISGAKQAVQNMLYYYLIALQESNVKDPKKVIATEIGEMIDLSEEQVDYVNMSINEGHKITENISNCIALLHGMLANNVLDVDSVKIVTKVLEILKKNIEKFIIKEDEDGQGEEETS